MAFTIYKHVAGGLADFWLDLTEVAPSFLLKGAVVGYCTAQFKGKHLKIHSTTTAKLLPPEELSDPIKPVDMDIVSCTKQHYTVELQGANATCLVELMLIDLDFVSEVEWLVKAKAMFQYDIPEKLKDYALCVVTQLYLKQALQVSPELSKMGWKVDGIMKRLNTEFNDPLYKTPDFIKQLKQYGQGGPHDTFL